MTADMVDAAIYHADALNEIIRDLERYGVLVTVVDPDEASDRVKLMMTFGTPR